MSERASNIRQLPTAARPLTMHAKRVSDVMPTRVSWLWPGRIALGKLTVVDGDPGLGKSTMTLDWAARVTRGLPMPGDTEGKGDCVGKPRGVIVLSAEDDASDTIRPRLEQAGADLDRVILLSLRDEEANEYLLSLDQNMRDIEGQIESADAALLIIDPLFSYVSSDVKSNSDQDVRRMLSPFTSMLARQRCAAVVLRHLNKNAGMASLYRGGGSIGIVGASRFALLVAKDPKDESGERLVLAVQKKNIGADVPSLAFRLNSVPGTDVARVEWIGVDSSTAQDLLGQGNDVERAGVREAEGWLFDLLKGGPLPTKNVQTAARDAGIGWRTVQEAKRILGVQADRQGFGRDGVWRWHLPPGIKVHKDAWDDDDA